MVVITTGGDVPGAPVPVLTGEVVVVVVHPGVTVPITGGDVVVPGTTVPEPVTTGAVVSVVGILAGCAGCG